MNNSKEENLYTNLGKRIAKYRKDQKLTQEQLSQKLGIKQSILAYYERGKRKPSISILLQIADILYVDIYDLLGLKKSGKPGPTSIIQKQLEEIKNLPLNKQRRILESLDDMLRGAKQKVS